MLFSISIHTLIFILLDFIIKIKYIHGQDSAENVREDTVNDFRKQVERCPVKLKIPCQGLSNSMNNIRLALTELELMNKISCSSEFNTPPETSRSASTVEPETHENQEITSESNPIQNTNNDEIPIGQRRIVYPINYNQPWSYYSNPYYQYGDGSYSNTGYYYPPRSPYMNIYPAHLQPSLPIVPYTSPSPFINRNYGSTIEESSTDISLMDLNENNMKRKRKNGRHCSRKRASRHMNHSEKKDESDIDNNFNETTSVINNDTDVNSH